MIKRIIEQLFWWYHTNEIESVDFDKEAKEGVYRYLASDEDVYTFLKSVAAGDKTRYFNAMDDASRQRIRGEYLRTRFLMNQILKQRDKDKPGSAGNKFGGRYGV